MSMLPHLQPRLFAGMSRWHAATCRRCGRSDRGALVIAIRVIDVAIRGRRGGVQPFPVRLGPVLLQVLLQALGHKWGRLDQKLLLCVCGVLHACTGTVLYQTSTMAAVLYQGCP